MSWATLNPTIRELAERELTPRQLEVFQHRLDGHSWQTISDVLDIDTSTAREHWERALRKMRPHLRKRAA